MWAGIMGTMFIVLFNLIALTTQKLGVAVASVANKLSLVIPFVFSLYLYNETSTLLKIIGIIIALVAVVLTCLPPAKNETAAHKKLSRSLIIILPTILFLGSGLLDTLVKYVEQTYLDDSNNNAYLIASFGTAAIIGSIVLLVMIITKKQIFNPKSIIAGIAIGVPNYFSIWSLVHVLKQNPGDSSTIIPVVNMGIVLFSSVAAWLIFKERLSVINWLGIILSVAAISLIAFG
jgi:drug/metabolite transporter (DMT)-like permease